MLTLRRTVAIIVAGVFVVAAAPSTASARSGQPAPGSAATRVAMPAAGKTGHDYVALGDSYAAGYGAGTSRDACGRTSWAYPELLAKVAGLELTFVACSGATIADVDRTQLAAVTSSADLVTLQVGGNDVGFVPVLGACAQADDAVCAGAVAQSRAYLDGAFVDHVTALYAKVRVRAPHAKLIVVGYPRLFGARDCSPLTEFTDAERQVLNATADLLNRRLRQAARSVAADFADPRDRFDGHAWCDRPAWITGPAHPAAFHPNVRGQVLGYLPVVGRHVLRR